MKLSEHFDLSEFTFSETAVRLGMPVTTTEYIEDNLRRLCSLILEPLRAELKAPIVISSGYRPPWLNKMIGGSANSDHMYGNAADFRVIGFTPHMVCQIAIELDLPFKQLIDEFGRWTHISISTLGALPLRQVLRARKMGSRTLYYDGLQEK